RPAVFARRAGVVGRLTSVLRRLPAADALTLIPLGTQRTGFAIRVGSAVRGSAVADVRTTDADLPQVAIRVLDASVDTAGNAPLVHGGAVAIGGRRAVRVRLTGSRGQILRRDQADDGFTRRE